MFLSRLIVIGLEYYYKLEELSPSTQMVMFLQFHFMNSNNNNQIQTPI